MSTLRISLFIGAVTLMFTGIGQAAEIISNEADGAAIMVFADNSTGTGNTGTSSARVGARVGEGNAIVLPFDLPDVNPTDITAATLQVQFNFMRNADGFGNDPGFDIDLYLLGRTAADPSILGDDYFAGETDAANTELINDFITEAAEGGVFSYGETSLVTLIQNQYAAFGPGHDFGGDDDFIFFRMNSDTELSFLGSDNAGFLFSMNDPDNAAAGDTLPTLSLDVIPEPASVALLGLGGLALLRRRSA